MGTEPLSVVVEQALGSMVAPAQFGEPLTDRADLNRVLPAVETGSDVEQTICEYTRALWAVAARRRGADVGDEERSIRFADAVQKKLLVEAELDMALTPTVESATERASAIRTIAWAVFCADVADRQPFRLSQVVSDAVAAEGWSFADGNMDLSALDDGPVQAGSDYHAVDLVYGLTEDVLYLLDAEQGYQETDKADSLATFEAHHYVSSAQQSVNRTRDALVERLSIRYPNTVEAVSQCVDEIINVVRSATLL